MRTSLTLLLVAAISFSLGAWTFKPRPAKPLTWTNAGVIERDSIDAMLHAYKPLLESADAEAALKSRHLAIIITAGICDRLHAYSKSGDAEREQIAKILIPQVIAIIDANPKLLDEYFVPLLDSENKSYPYKVLYEEHKK